MSVATIKEGNLLGAVLLIAGSSIGAGMIGLPVISAAAGFMPTTIAMMLCYGFAVMTGLLLVEANLWFKEKVNLLTLVEFALGKTGKAITWFLFLFLFYCLFVAYIDGGGVLIAHVLSNLFGLPIAREFGIAVSVSFVGLIVYGGTLTVSRTGRVFLLGLVFSYCALLSFGLPHVKAEPLLHTNWKGAVMTLPILLVCFGYQNLIPTLVSYVRRDPYVLRSAILIGNLIPFAIYFMWNLVILGILPEAGSALFAEAVSQDNLVTGLLEKASESESVIFFAELFSFFAILTPFMTNTMAFVDFIKDGLKISTESKFKLLPYLLVLIPPTLLTLLYPHLFLKALGFAGGFADVILFGVFPVLIVWIGRYVKKVESPYTVSGGKIFLVTLLIFSLGILLIRN